MDQIMVVYWSSTGNTEAMAKCIGEGIQAAGKEAKVVDMDSISADELKDCSVFAMGASAMGDEELDDGTAEPFVEEVEKFAAGKKIALFGSYDWGDGEWMRKWIERMQNAGAEIVGGEGLICNNEPQAEDEENCKELGKKLAEQ